jgi:uncharacterized protein (UPF0548 family)
MTAMYLLTACTDNEGEEPLFYSATVDAAKGVAETDLTESNFAPDGYRIYDVRPEGKPVLLLACDALVSWDPASRRVARTIAVWANA